MASVYLVEWTPRRPSDNQPQTFYWATEPGYRTGDGDTPANVFYEPRVSNPGSIGRFIFGDGRTSGGSQINFGNVRLRNADKGLDAFVAQDWGVDGAELRIYIGDTAAERSTFTLVATMVTENIEAYIDLSGRESQVSLDLIISDPMSDFDRPAQIVKYKGTNVGPVGFEGTKDDIGGSPKPFAYGAPKNVTAKLANASLLVFDVGDSVVHDFSAVYDNALALNDDGDVGTQSSLISQAVLSGSYLTCKNTSQFRLGASPAGLITADIVVSADPIPRAAAIDLNGSSQYLWQDGDPLGMQLGTGKGTFSAWFRVDGGNGTERALMCFPRGGYEEWIGLDSSNHLFRQCDASHTTTTTTAITASSTWHHVLVAWDRDAGVTHIVLDGTDLTVGGATGEDTDQYYYAFVLGAAAGISGTPVSRYWNGCLAEIWYTSDYIDFSAPANILLFRTSGGLPANLGMDGSTPFGEEPLLYARGTPEQFTDNLGSGGNLIAVGTPTDASTTPYGDVTSASLISGTAGNLIKAIALQRGGLSLDRIDGAAFDQLNIDAPQLLGGFQDREIDVREVLDEIAGSVGAWYIFDRNRNLTVGKMTLPGMSPSFTFTAANILRMKAVIPVDDGRGIPAYSIIVKYQKNYTVQEDGIAGAVTAERRAFLEKEFRQINVPDNTIKRRHPKAPEIEFVSLIIDDIEATAFHDFLKGLYGRKNTRYIITAKLDATTAQIDLGHDVMVQLDRFGLDDGMMFRVIGVDLQLDRNLVDFDVAFGAVHNMSGSAAGTSTASGHLTEEIANGAIGWWRADDVTYSSTGTVSAMADKTGNGNTLIALNASLEPAWTASEALINSKPMLTFNGDVLFKNGGFTGFDPGDYTVFAVARVLGNGPGDGVLLTLGGSGNLLVYPFGGGANIDNLYAEDNNSGGTDTVALEPLPGAWVGLMVRRSAALIEAQISGYAIDSLAVPAADTFSGFLAIAGTDGSGGGSSPLNCSVAELILYEAAVDDVRANEVRAYLATRYGISWDLPRANRTVQGGANRTVQGGAIRQVIDES